MPQKRKRKHEELEAERQAAIRTVLYWLERQCGKPARLTVDDEMRFTAHFHDATAKEYSERLQIMEQDGFLKIDGYMSGSLNRDGSEDLIVRFFWTPQPTESMLAITIKRIRSWIGV